MKQLASSFCLVYFACLRYGGLTVLYSAANDHRLEMIPQTGNDPQIRPQMIPPENKEGHGVWFHGFFLYIFILFLYLFISINQTMNEINIKKRYSDDVNYNFNIILMANSSYFLLTILLKSYWKNIKAPRQQYYFSTSSIYSNNS